MPFSFLDPASSGRTVYAAVRHLGSVVALAPMSEGPPGRFSAAIPASLPRGDYAATAYAMSGATPDPDSDWPIASGAIRVREPSARFRATLPALAGRTLYAVASFAGVEAARVPMAEVAPGIFSGDLPGEMASRIYEVRAMLMLGGEADPDSDWAVAIGEVDHPGSGLRIPEAIIRAARDDDRIATLLPGGVWFGQADDSALGHPAYAEIHSIPPGEIREATHTRGVVSKEIVTSHWGVAIYATDPIVAERARDAWTSAFRPGGSEPPDVDDGAGLCWWSARGDQYQDNDTTDREGDPVYVRTVLMRTRHSVGHAPGPGASAPGPGASWEVPGPDSITISYIEGTDQSQP